MCPSPGVSPSVTFTALTLYMSNKMKIPQSIGVIGDGNRRWAKSHGLLPFAGHEEGAKRYKEFADWAAELGVKYVTAYIFSTENWNRPAAEVDFLLNLFKKTIADELDIFHGKNMKIRIVGDRTRFSKDLVTVVEHAEQVTAANTGLCLVFAFSYGGREEILSAVRAIYKEDSFIDKPISGEDFEKYLWTHGIPDPEIVVRTSGEQRLSNFLPWQSTYSELFFLDKMWPEITKGDLEQVFIDYADRERRFGA